MKPQVVLAPGLWFPGAVLQLLARRLEKRFKLPVARIDERFTSVEAESRLKGLKHKAVDSVAAQLILEQYFDEAA